MTIYYPDISGYEAGASFSGVEIAVAKATEGTGYVNPDYYAAKLRAAKAGAFFCAYHFLHTDNAGAQARYAHGVVGNGVPLMVDAEASPTPPSVADIAAFVTIYRQLGGVCHLLYLPRWYWADMGSPSLAPVIALGMVIVSSDYTGYSATGPGWDAYGGMTPKAWQYTSTATLNGTHNVDYNAFQGSRADFESLAATGALSGAEPVLSEGDTGAAVKQLQARLNAWGDAVTADGSFGPATLSALKRFQAARHLTADGVAGPATWTALDAAPPVPGPTPYPAPGGLKVSSAAVAVTWAPVVVDGKPAASYTVQAVGNNGQVFAHETALTNSAVLTGLVSGWQYSVLVWANGGPSAPPHASIEITV